VSGQRPRLALLASIGLLGLWFLRAFLIRPREAGPDEPPAFSPSPESAAAIRSFPQKR
jgi:hypothetical protein